MNVRRYKLLLSGLLIVVLVLAIVPFAVAQEGSRPEAVGLRPDAPVYAVHGPYWVGTGDYVIEPDSETPLPVTVWYPALNPEGAEVSITYPVTVKFNLGPGVTTEFYGQAVRDATPDSSAAPYPLVIFSHGFSANPAWYAYLVEHLASYGFVVVAPDHPAEGMYSDSDPWQDIPKATVARPRDVGRAIDYAESLTAAGGTLSGMIDLDLVAVAGHSYGGYTALAAAGARYDPVGFHQRCQADRAAGDPFVWLCDTLIPFEGDMAEMAAFSATPTDLWPSWGDPRVDAIIPMAGDSYMFDQRGLAEITIPVLAMGGTLDTSTPYEWGAHPTYQYVSSPQKALVSFANAEHGIFVTSCDAGPWLIEIGFFTYCADAVWDKNRAHDLIKHFVTAFLLATLKDDPAAAAALAPDQVQFPGIEYQAQGF